MRARDAHQFAHLVVRNKGRRATAPGQLFDAARAVEQRALQGDLAMQALQVGRGARAVLGDDLVAAAVKTQARAKRQVKIQRERQRGVAVAWFSRRSWLGRRSRPPDEWLEDTYAGGTLYVP